MSYVGTRLLTQASPASIAGDCVVSLKKLQAVSALQPLFDAVAWGDDFVLKAAGEALLRIASPQTADAMLPILLSRLNGSDAPNATMAEDLQVRVRAAAADLLGMIKHPAAVASLTRALGETWTVFKSAAHALCEIGTAEAITSVVPELLNRLQRKGDEYDRLTAVELLGRIGEHSFVPALKEMLSDPSPLVSSRAVTALRLIGTAEAMRAIEGIEGSGTPLADH